MAKKKIEEEKVEEVKVEKTKVEKPKNKIYFSYTFRLYTSIILFVIFIVLSAFVAIKMFSYENSKTINYKEKENLNYKVYLKENDYYEDEYLSEGMRYVASLIDNIDINFNYDFSIEEAIDLNFDYKIIGELFISSSNGNTNYLTRKYTLLESKHASINNDKHYNIQENVVIDYDHYNSLANGFKSSFAVDTNSYLKVSLVIDKSNSDYKELQNNSEYTMTIPLSQSAIEIAFDSDNKDISNSIKADAKLVVNKYALIIAIVCFLVAIVNAVKTIRLLVMVPRKKSEYDKFIDRVLREYDRLIVETTTGVKQEDGHIMNVLTFEELLDVRDNLKLPIMYYNIVAHQKCCFYVKHNDDIYLLKVKAVDMELANNDENK